MSFAAQPKLLFETGNHRADGILIATIAAFEERFPNQALAYYLTGSFAESDPIPTSDVDVVIVIPDLGGGHEMLKRADSLRARSQGMLDPVVIAVTLLSDPYYVHIAAGLKQGSRLLYGKDLADAMPDPSPEAFGLWASGKAFELMRNLRSSGVVLDTGLEAPDSTDEFLGYIAPRATLRNPSGTIGALKPMAAINMLAAMAMLARENGRVAATRPGCVEAARKLLSSSEAAQTAGIHGDVRMNWHYRMPVVEPDRRQLATYCEQTLVMERALIRAMSEHEGS